MQSNKYSQSKIKQENGNWIIIWSGIKSNCVNRSNIFSIACRGSASRKGNTGSDLDGSLLKCLMSIEWPFFTSEYGQREVEEILGDKFGIVGATMALRGVEHHPLSEIMAMRKLMSCCVIFWWDLATSENMFIW